MTDDEGGEWQNDLWVDLRADRYIQLQYQGVGAHPWIPEQRNGLVRGIYNCMQADGRYAGRQLISEAQFCLNTMLSTSGLSAYQLVFGCNLADNFGWGDEDEDPLFSQCTSLSEQFVAQWELRVMAQEAASKEIAYSKQRRIWAINNSFDSADVRVGDEVLSYEAPPRKSAPRWRGPAKVWPLGESGAVLSFQGRACKVARHCVRKKVRTSVESEASCEGAFDDLSRSAPPREVPDQPPIPLLGSLDLYKRNVPPSPDSSLPGLPFSRPCSVEKTRRIEDGGISD